VSFFFALLVLFCVSCLRLTIRAASFDDDFESLLYVSSSPSTGATKTDAAVFGGNNGISSATATTTKKKKKKQNKDKIRSNGENKGGSTSSSPSTTIMSEQELADHVSELYVRGPGGVFHVPRRRKRKEEEEAKQQRGGVLPRRDDRRTSSDTASDTDDDDAATDSSSSYDSEAARLFLERRPALVLNADYQPLNYLPLSLWNWQEAVKAVFSGKVTVVDVYPDAAVRAANFEIPLPSVIALTEYVKPPRDRHKPAFTKRNVFLRDEYRCQYCDGRFYAHELSLDHVVPRCRGGRLQWTNAVTSCRPCNGKKGSLPVERLRQVGMRLLRQPRVPSQMQLASIAGRMKPTRGVHPTWEPYLGVVHHRHRRNGNDDNGDERATTQFATEG